MAGPEKTSTRSRALAPLAAVGSKVAAVTIKPVAAVTVKPLAGVATGAASAALDAGIEIERRAVDFVLDSAELERVLTAAIESPRVQAAMSKAIAGRLVRDLIAGFVDGPAMDDLVDRLLDSDALWRLVDTLLDRLAESDSLARFVDTLLDRLTESEALWRLVDEVAGSPSVTAAITQQSIGFAEEVRDDVRTRSRRADDWLSRVARRLGPRPEERDRAGGGTTCARCGIGAGGGGPGGPRATRRRVDRGGRRSGSQWRWSGCQWRRSGCPWRCSGSRRRRRRRGPERRGGADPRGRSRRGALMTIHAEPDGLQVAPPIAPPAEPEPVLYIGLVTRAIAFAIDAGVINVVAAVVAAGTALIISLLHLPKAFHTAIAVVAAAAWGLWAIGYFVAFWTLTGQTPGRPGDALRRS